MAQRFDDGPILLIGAGRSGTTFFKHVLDAHPQVDFHGETDFLAARLWREIYENRFWFEWRRSMELHQHDTFFELPPLSREAELDHRTRCGNAVAAAVRTALGVTGDKVWGYKEIWNGSGGHQLGWDGYDSAFPQARWVHLVRNPMTFAFSCARWNRDSPDDAYLRARLSDWVGMTRMSRQRRSTGRFLEIRYEDLVSRPEEVLTPVLQACGLDWDAACTTAAERRLFETGKEDQRGDGTRIGRFTHDVMGLGDLCDELGYDTSRAFALPRVANGAGVAIADLRRGTMLDSIELKGFKSAGGQAWFASLPQCAALCDTSEQPRRSPLGLRENTRALGPPHALHDDIRKHGSGAFSHWGDGVYFSTSDSSNPNKNGRSYWALVPRHRPGM